MSRASHGLTLDAGALIAYESGDDWIRQVITKAIVAEAPLTIDATVAVSAAQRGDTVITADAKDFLRLADDLRAIHVWAPTLR